METGEEKRAADTAKPKTVEVELEQQPAFRHREQVR